MIKVVQDRMEGGEAARRDDILQILIDTRKNQNPEERLSVDAIITETLLFLIAGSETASNTTGFAVIELLKRPEALAKLQQEINMIPLENGEFFKHDQLKHLQYSTLLLTKLWVMTGLQLSVWNELLLNTQFWPRIFLFPKE